VRALVVNRVDIPHELLKQNSPLRVVFVDEFPVFQIGFFDAGFYRAHVHFQRRRSRSGRGGSGFAQGERLLGRGEHVLPFVLSFGVM